MTKRKLFEEIKHNPQRYYRAPSDVNRDRRFSDEERFEILAAWEHGMRATCESEGEEDSRLRQVVEAKAEVEKRMPLQGPRNESPRH